MKLPRMPMRWRFGEWLVGLGAIVLGLGIAMAAVAGMELSPWLLVLMPLVVIGTTLYVSRVISPFPTGVERPRHKSHRR